MVVLVVMSSIDVLRVLRLCRWTSSSLVVGGKCQSQSEFSGKCTHGPAEAELSAISAILELALYVGLYIVYSPYSLHLLGSTNGSHDQRGTRLQ
jgi:hypothetical protein